MYGEFLHCSPETTTTLLISYMPMQNVCGVKKKITRTDFLFHCCKYVQYEYVIRMYQALIEVWTVIRDC